MTGYGQHEREEGLDLQFSYITILLNFVSSHVRFSMECQGFREAISILFETSERIVLILKQIDKPKQNA